eukprot:2434737-Rhodomonas_salina.3
MVEGADPAASSWCLRRCGACIDSDIRVDQEMLRIRSCGILDWPQGRSAADYPKQIKEIKDFLHIARRKDASCKLRSKV